MNNIKLDEMGNAIDLQPILEKCGFSVVTHPQGYIVNGLYLVACRKKKWKVIGKNKWYWYSKVEDLKEYFTKSSATSVLKSSAEQYEPKLLKFNLLIDKMRREKIESIVEDDDNTPETLQAGMATYEQLLQADGPACLRWDNSIYMHEGIVLHPDGRYTMET